MDIYDYEFCDLLYEKFVSNIVLTNSDNGKLSISGIIDFESL